jgi:hypothetical protein
MVVSLEKRHLPDHPKTYGLFAPISDFPSSRPAIRFSPQQTVPSPYARGKSSGCPEHHVHVKTLTQLIGTIPCHLHVTNSPQISSFAYHTFLSRSSSKVRPIIHTNFAPPSGHSFEVRKYVSDAIVPRGITACRVLLTLLFTARFNRYIPQFRTLGCVRQIARYDLAFKGDVRFQWASTATFSHHTVPLGVGVRLPSPSLTQLSATQSFCDPLVFMHVRL